PNGWASPAVTCVGSSSGIGAPLRRRSRRPHGFSGPKDSWIQQPCRYRRSPSSPALVACAASTLYSPTSIGASQGKGGGGSSRTLVPVKRPRGQPRGRSESPDGVRKSQPVVVRDTSPQRAQRRP